MTNKESIQLDELRRLTDSVLKTLGQNTHEREVVTDVLLYAEMRGKSQGLVKILERTVEPDPARGDISVQQRTPCIHYLEANGNLGMVVLQEAADRAIAACRVNGMAVSVACGTNTSTGSIGYYAERIANEGFIAMVMAGSPKVMALHGSQQRALGTNPVAFAIPTLEAPLVFDMATSAITWFDIIKLSREDGTLPAGVAVDKAGQPTQSPAAALEGVLLPFAGSKGSGLALIIECFTGPLAAASLLGDSEDSRGNFILAIDPDAVLPVADPVQAGAQKSLQQSGFAGRTSVMLQRMAKECGPNFRFPGQRSQQLARQCHETGKVEIDTAVLQELRQF